MEPPRRVVALGVRDLGVARRFSPDGFGCTATADARVGVPERFVDDD